MADWKRELLDYADRHGRERHDTEFGVGIGFADGCDVFWVLPGEFVSTVPCPVEGPEPERDLIGQYEAIDRVRSQVIHVLRWRLAENGFPVKRYPHGGWLWLSKTGGIRQNIDVGSRLTRWVLDGMRLDEMIMRTLPYGLKTPARSIDEYMALPSPPPNERDFNSADVEEEKWPRKHPDAKTVIAGEVRQNVLHNSQDRIDLRREPGRIRRDPADGEKIIRLFLKLGDLLSDCHVSWHGRQLGTLRIWYDDGYDDFSIDPNSPDITSLARQEDIDHAASSLARAFRQMNFLRGRVFSAIWAVANDYGWFRSTFDGIPIFFEVPTVVRLGKTHHEVDFEPGPTLTKSLQAQTPEQVLRETFADRPDFAEACIARLDDAFVAEVDPPKEQKLVARQPAVSIPDSLLVDVTQERILELDQFAEATLSAFMAKPEAINRYNDPDFFDPKTDTWCSPDDWLRLAERQLTAAASQGDLFDNTLKILTDAGDPRGEQITRQYLETLAPDDFSDEEDDIRTIWRYRHANPDLARYVFLDQYGAIMYPTERADLGDPVALRYQTHISGTLTDIIEDNDFANLHALRALSPQDRETLHRHMIHVAETSDRMPPDCDLLTAAQTLGFPDVAEALERNPYLLPGLLTAERRVDQFDEPGLLWADGLLLAWSRLNPSPFLARILLTAHSIDLVDRATTWVRRTIEGQPDREVRMYRAENAYRMHKEKLDLRVAIAWKRCRDNLSTELG